MLVFAEVLWPNGGGAELATNLFVNSLVGRGYDVTVITGQHMVRSQDGARTLTSGALVAKSKTELWINILSRSADFENVIRDHEVVYIPRLCYPIAPVAKKLGKRVFIHLHDYLPISYTAAVPAPFEQTAEYARSVQGFNLWLEGRRGRAAQSLAVFGRLYTSSARRWLSYADRLICVSDRQAQIMALSAPELKSLLTRVYNPLPEMPKIPRRPRREPLFLYVGGDSFHKGFHIFMKVADQLLSQGVSVRFLITGDANRRDQNLLSNELSKFTGAFETPGRMPYGSLLEQYFRVRGLVFPSIWEEPLSYAIAESMSAGTIPIASRVGGNSELIGGSAAARYLFEPFGLDSLIDNVKEVLSLSEDELLSIGENLKLSISNTLRAEETTEKFVRFFEE